MARVPHNKLAIFIPCTLCVCFFTAFVQSASAEQTEPATFADSKVLLKEKPPTTELVEPRGDTSLVAEFTVHTEPAGELIGFVELVPMGMGEDESTQQVQFFMAGATAVAQNNGTVTTCDVLRGGELGDVAWGAECSLSLNLTDLSDLRFSVVQTKRGTGPGSNANVDEESELVAGFWYSASLHAGEKTVALGSVFAPDSVTSLNGENEPTANLDVLGLSLLGEDNISSEISGPLKVLQPIAALQQQAVIGSSKTESTYNVDNLSENLSGGLLSGGLKATSQLSDETLPVRAYDSRNDWRGTLRAGTSRTVPLDSCNPTWGSGNPSQMIVNITAVNPNGNGFLTAWGSGNRPNRTSVSYKRATNTAGNISVIPLNNDLNIYSSATTHVIIDCHFKVIRPNGATAGRFSTGMILKAQKRIYDSRSSTIASLKPGAGRAIQVSGSKLSGGLTRDFSYAPLDYAILNVTAVRAKDNGFLRAYKPGTTSSLSVLNFTPSGARANRVFVPVSSSGKIELATSVETDVIIDAVGWLSEYSSGRSTINESNYVGGGFYGYIFGGAMRRAFDSRLYGNRQRVSSSTPQTIYADATPTPNSESIPTVAEVIVTVTSATGTGSLAVSAKGAGNPGTSVVNFEAGSSSSNSTFVPLDRFGRFDIHVSKSAHVIVDVTNLYFDPTQLNL